MSPLFGKKQSGKLLALIDIESGSVGSALAYIESGKKPRLFAQTRLDTAVHGTPSASNILKEIERDLEESFIHLNTVASRMREALPQGQIARVAVFLHAPWVGTQLALEHVVPKAHDETLDRLRVSAEGFFESVPVSFHSFATTTTPIAQSLFGNPQEAIVCSIGSEVTELVLMRQGKIAGHATSPVGLSTIVRTLKAHAGLSDAEALSILSLSRHTREHLWAEATASALKHFASEIQGAAQHVVSQDHAQQVFVLSPKNSGDWFARGLTEEGSMHELFSPGSTIRSIAPRHASAYLSGHPKMPDLPLMLESLFVDMRFGAQK